MSRKAAVVAAIAGLGSAVPRDGGRNGFLVAAVVVRVINRKRWAGVGILVLIFAALAVLAYVTENKTLDRACDLYQVHDMQPAYCRYDLNEPPDDLRQT